MTFLFLFLPWPLETEHRLNLLICLDVSAGQKGRSAVPFHAVAIKSISHAHPIVIAIKKMDEYTQKIATTQAADPEMNKAKE